MGWTAPEANAARQAQCNASQAQGSQFSKPVVSTDLEVPSHNQDISMTEPAEAAELRAKMEETKQKIAAAKARKNRKRTEALEQKQNARAEVPMGQPQNQDQHGQIPPAAASSGHPDSTDTTVHTGHVVSCGSMQAANSMPSSKASLQQGQVAHEPTHAVQHTNVSSYNCQAPVNSSNAQARWAQDPGSHSPLDQTTLNIARRRFSHAGLATAATQQKYNAIVKNPPEVLREPHPNQHQANRSVFTTPPGPQQLQPQMPPQQASMTRTEVNAEMHNSPCLLCISDSLQTSLLTQSQDTAAPMDIDSASSCHSFYDVVTEPFGQELCHACGPPSGILVQGADSPNATCNHSKVLDVQQASAPRQSMHDDRVDLMDIDTNMC